MPNTVKKQHYVWRNYLVPWTNNKDLKTGKVFVYRKHLRGNQTKIEWQGLTKIGFENYFYDISGFTENDIAVYKQFISYFQKNSRVKFELNIDEINTANKERDFIEKVAMCSSEEIDNKYQFRKKLMKHDLSFYEDSDCRKVCDILQKAIIDSILYQEQVLSEKKAMELFKYALQNIDEPDLKYEFNLFLCMQFCRSPRIHNNLSTCFEEFKEKSSGLSKLNTKFNINLMALLFAQKMALNMTYKLNMSMELYINKSSLPFITGDTPVVNVSDNQNIAEFYYPVSPTIAIKVMNSQIPIDNSLITIERSRENLIEIFNNKLYKNCVNEIYSSNESACHKLESIND